MDGQIFQFIEHIPYLGLLLVLLAAGLGVPLPEDIPLLAAGWLVHHGRADLTAMIVVGLFGVLCGDLILFSMGRRYGEHIVEHRWMRRVVTPARLARAEGIYARHGVKIIFAARFMPGLRGVLFMTAGIFRVKPWKFLLIDGSAAVASVPLLVWLGARFGARIEQLAGDVRQAQMAAAGLLALAVAAWIAWEVYAVRRRKRIEAAAPVVLLGESGGLEGLARETPGQRDTGTASKAAAAGGRPAEKQAVEAGRP